MLFSLPFAAVGVFMTGWLWRDVARSREIMATWAVAPAVIESAELKSQRGSKSTTYEAVGTFSYTYEGRHYRSDRLGLDTGADNIGNYQKNLHRDMKSARRKGSALECRVNPANPEEAILRPEWRPEMALFRAMFGIFFGGAGFGMLAGSALSLMSSSRQGFLKNRYSQEPWLARPEWRNPTLQARLGKGMAIATAILVWINLVTWPLWSALRPVWAGNGVFKWVLSGALLLVVIASAFCARVIIHARKYRGARLELGELPLRPGAPVLARLYLPGGLPLGAVLRLALTCEKHVSVGRGKQRRTTTTKLWSHLHEERGPLAPGQEVVFRCTLPAGAPVTTLDNPDDVQTWSFTARAEVPGVDLNLDFEVPVFARTTT